MCAGTRGWGVAGGAVVKIIERNLSDRKKMIN